MKLLTLLMDCRVTHYEEGEHMLTNTHPHLTLYTLLLNLLTVISMMLSQLSWASLIHLGVRLPTDTIYEADILLMLLNLPLYSHSHATLQAISIVFDSFNENAKEHTHPMLILSSMTFLEVLPDFEWPLEDAFTSYEEYKVTTVSDLASAGVAEHTCTLQLSGVEEFLRVFDPCWVAVIHLGRRSLAI